MLLPHEAAETGGPCIENRIYRFRSLGVERKAPARGASMTLKKKGAGLTRRLGPSHQLAMASAASEGVANTHGEGTRIRAIGDGSCRSGRGVDAEVAFVVVAMHGQAGVDIGTARQRIRVGQREGVTLA